jgi:hypothetical protein
VVAVRLQLLWEVGQKAVQATSKIIEGYRKG